MDASLLQVPCDGLETEACFVDRRNEATRQSTLTSSFGIGHTIVADW